MAPRVPPKLQIYIEEYHSHDIQRLQKGQFAKIEIEGPPALSEEVLGLASADGPTPVTRQNSYASITASEASQSGAGTPGVDEDGDAQSLVSMRNRLSRRPSPVPQKRTPHLEKVNADLDGAAEELRRAREEVRIARRGQQSGSERISQLSKDVNAILELANGEAFQQVRPSDAYGLVHLADELDTVGHCSCGCWKITLVDSAISSGKQAVSLIGRGVCSLESSRAFFGRSGWASCEFGNLSSRLGKCSDANVLTFPHSSIWRLTKGFVMLPFEILVYILHLLWRPSRKMRA